MWNLLKDAEENLLFSPNNVGILLATAEKVHSESRQHHHTSSVSELRFNHRWPPQREGHLLLHHHLNYVYAFENQWPDRSMSSNFNATNLKCVVDRLSPNTSTVKCWCVSTVKYVLVSPVLVKSLTTAPVTAHMRFIRLTLFCLPARPSSPVSNHPLSLSTRMNAVLLLATVFFSLGTANRAILTWEIPTSIQDDWGQSPDSR